MLLLVAAKLALLGINEINYKENSLKLNYVLINPRAQLTLNLYDSELYEAAVIVQPLVGNLVYYSNFGRYEPRIASSWQRENSTTWVFQLKSGFVCENGEVINALSFKKSLERTILYLGRQGGIPVLQKLKGYNDFINGKNNELIGILANQNTLSFKFDEPIKSGLIQILSFAPFGFISKENLNEDGSWKDNTKFISSGPYRVKTIDVGTNYIIEKRPDWPILNKKSPTIVEFTHKVPNNEQLSKYLILDSFSEIINPGLNLVKFKLVPEYINPILLGNLENGFFSNKLNRIVLKKYISKFRDQLLPSEWDVHTRSSTFYPNQQTLFKKDNVIEFSDVQSSPKNEIIIEGEIPQKNTTRWYAWIVLKAALDELKWKYKFANNEVTDKSISDHSYDIRIRGSSIGGGVEAWGLGVVFCSKVGNMFSDPTKTICKLVSDYENDLIDDNELAKRFLNQVEEDSTIIPISHYGLQMYISENISQSSISPLISVMRFDDLVLD